MAPASTQRIAPLIAGLDETMLPLGGPRSRKLIRAPFTGEAIGSVPACTAEMWRSLSSAPARQQRWVVSPLAVRRRDLPSLP